MSPLFRRVRLAQIYCIFSVNIKYTIPMFHIRTFLQIEYNADINVLRMDDKKERRRREVPSSTTQKPQRANPGLHLRLPYIVELRA